MSTILLYTCFASLIFVLLGLGGLLRLLPPFLVILARLLRITLILSYRLYALLISQLNLFTQPLFRINLAIGIWRLVTCVIFSALFGYLFLWLFDLIFTWWVAGLWLLHGVTVAIAWDEIQKPGGLQLGERIR